MRKCNTYPQEVRAEIITKFKQSGLSQNQFCNLSDVPITNSTLSEWLKKAGYDKFGIPFGKKQEPASSELNIVCYHIGENTSFQSEEGNVHEPTLQVMIEFQKDVYDCCSHLYRLSCNERNIKLLSQIKRALR